MGTGNDLISLPKMKKELVPVQALLSFFCLAMV
jgi:hypothetical protein